MREVQKGDYTFVINELTLGVFKKMAKLESTEDINDYDEICQLVFHCVKKDGVKIHTDDIPFSLLVEVMVNDLVPKV